MESPQPKKQKGIKKIWARFKILLKPKPLSATSPTTLSDSFASVPNKTSTQTNLNTMEPPSSVPAPSQPEKLESESIQPSISSSQPAPISIVAQSHPQGDSRQSSRKDDFVEVDNDFLVDPDFPLLDYHRPTSSAGTDPALQTAEIVRDIYSRYGWKFEPIELKFKAKSQNERVEGKPRLRVRWTCHECKSTFGKEKSCPKCTHSRCHGCTRYPPKKFGDKVRQTTVNTMSVPSTSQQPITGTCHECKTAFDFLAAQCENCHHQICERCLKESIEEASLATDITAAS